MSATSATSPISVVIPTYRRPAQLLATLAQIERCSPRPAEVLVHIDAGDQETEPIVARHFPGVTIVSSSERQGPGGGRNKLIAMAAHEMVTSFDDDSYPLDDDYFARIETVLARFPDAAVVASQITDKGHVVPEAQSLVRPTVHFGGGGATYRRSSFLECGGYVPLAVAYGMEEVDMCMRLLDRGKRIYFSPWLRVFHDNDLSHHASPKITSASIANLALLVFLRYPLRYWAYGAMQIANRVLWLVRARRVSGIGAGVAAIPAQIWRHRAMRAPVSASTLARFLKDRRIVQASTPIADGPQSS